MTLSIAADGVLRGRRVGATTATQLRTATPPTAMCRQAEGAGPIPPARRLLRCVEDEPAVPSPEEPDGRGRLRDPVGAAWRMQA
jgi:hypothetical protein